MMATMIAFYLLTGNIIFIIAIVIDYFIRAFTMLPYSPFSWMAMQIERWATWAPKWIDKAPKIFAARLYHVHLPRFALPGQTIGIKGVIL